MNPRRASAQPLTQLRTASSSTTITRSPTSVDDRDDLARLRTSRRRKRFVVHICTPPYMGWAAEQAAAGNPVTGHCGFARVPTVPIPPHAVRCSACLDALAKQRGLAA